MHYKEDLFSGKSTNDSKPTDDEDDSQYGDILLNYSKGSDNGDCIGVPRKQSFEVSNLPQNNCYTTSCSETESLDDRVTEPTSPLAPRNITKLLNQLSLE